jgi:hypothetical protein
MSTTNIDEHILKPRKCSNKLPTLVIITGDTMVGKTNLSFLLRGSAKSYYVSLDQITLDEKLPIKNINDMVNRLGYDFSSRSILKFCDEVFKNKTVFIDYCFNFILKRNERLFIFDSVYFTNEDFLNEFIKKFENNYYIWVATRPLKK